MSARFMVMMTLALLMGAATAQAEQVFAVTTIVSAQDAADDMARTGVLRHCGRAGGRREGIGFSTSGPDAAFRNCCYYQDAQRGRYRIVERGVARGPRGWFAVIRYE
jgi:hypothetical protein